jgi:hypothetical protein
VSHQLLRLGHAEVTQDRFGHRRGARRGHPLHGPPHAVRAGRASSPLPSSPST